MSTELMVIFNNCVQSDSVKNEIVPFDDGFAYTQKQYQSKTKHRKNKVLPPPSKQAVQAFYAGDKKGLGKIVYTFGLRSILIGGALAMFGENKDQRAIVRNSLVASGAIEAFLLYWYGRQK